MNWREEVWCKKYSRQLQQYLCCIIEVQFMYISDLQQSTEVIEHYISI